MLRYALVGLMVAALAGCEWNEKDRNRDSTSGRTSQSTMSQSDRTSANPDWNKSNTSPNANNQSRSDWDRSSNADMNRNSNDMNAQPAGARTENQNAAFDDRQFVTEAASAGLFETKSAELAKDKGSSEMVKTYADHLKQDHNQANQDLMGIANRKGIQAPTEMMPPEKATYDRLAGLSGADFDRQFLQAQVQAHQQAVQLFEDASKNAKDADIKAFAAQYLPALRDHLKMAQDHAQHLMSDNQPNQ